MEQIKLSKDKKSLKIEAWIKEVENYDKFEKVTHEPIFIESRDLKGIVFHVKHKYNNPEAYIEFITNGEDYIKLQADQENVGLGWDIGDKVRIMYFNDIDGTNFNKLIPYFVKRLVEFGIRDNVTDQEYERFTNTWNSENEDNQIVYRNTKKILKPKQTIKDDILTITG